MKLVQIYQCFCDPTRLRILHLLTQTPLCVCHFQDALREPQVKISKHLAYLRSRGLVANETNRELDHLFVAGETVGGAGDEFEMSAGLRFVGSGFSQGPAASGGIEIELLRTGWRFRRVKSIIYQPMKQRVLFICIHNSARSQMAEAWMNQICGDQFEAQSAGLEPGTLNPLVVEVMAEVGIDISHKGTQRVFDVWKSGPVFAYVVTVCDESSAEKCPIFPGPTKPPALEFSRSLHADRNARRKTGRGAQDPR